MPPRKKPTSTRQKKAGLKLKRAIKRGDVSPPENKTPIRKPKTRRGPTGTLIGSATDPSRAAVVQAARRLQSAFINLPPKFLEETRLLASTLPLSRPLLDRVAVFTDITYNQQTPNLSCPRRPKWRFDMTKKQVESNEEGVFNKWLTEVDEIVQKQQVNPTTEDHIDENILSLEPLRAMPKSPTYFERNIEVWRQLWRVTEISEIILILVDSRCPLLHFPPSLSDYVSHRQVILVLTKVDISGSARADAWTQYFYRRYPHLHVVQVESYAEKETGADHQGRKQFQPHLPTPFRQKLVNAIKEVHTTLLHPPDKIKDNPDRLKNWKPSVKQIINWDDVLNVGESAVDAAAETIILPHSRVAQDEQLIGALADQEPEYLTIGLIGQPNVGKSSLLNALFGENKVRASKTPGKTKHFQTLFWTRDVRLVDCPGLVMPNFAPMEMQVLCGILPISRISAIPSCIHFAAELLPLEKIYKLIHPALSAPPIEDKRTWRNDMKVKSSIEKEPLRWTAMDILIAYADSKSWVTAKAGRPDVHRAGNAILRSLAEGKIGWAFWPPLTDACTIALDTEQGDGIWIPRVSTIDEDSENDSEVEQDLDSDGKVSIPENVEEGEDDEDKDEDENDNDGKLQGFGSRFGALLISDEDEQDDVPHD